MKKLIQGIMDFRSKLTPERQDTFARLALGQSPDALFIGCSDSRVAVNVFASTDPGDLFVVRNVGNMVPPCGIDGQSSADESEAAAIEFALQNLGVRHIIICGHSECGAMQALSAGRENVKMKNLRAWLRHGEKALGDLTRLPGFAASLTQHNRLSQFNVLRQMHHLKTYPIVRSRLEAGSLMIHGWWFDLAKAEVYAWEEDLNEFVSFDDTEGKRILERLGHGAR